MPNTHLYDYAGYSVVVRPQHETLSTFVQTYKQVLRDTFTPGARLRKLWSDVPSLLAAGYWDTSLVDIVQNAGTFFRRPHPDRSYVPESDVTPPEISNVPLVDDDFESDEQKHAIMEPWAVTDARGYVLPQWRTSQQVHVRTTVAAHEAVTVMG